MKIFYSKNQKQKRRETFEIRSKNQITHTDNLDLERRQISVKLFANSMKSPVDKWPTHTFSKTKQKRKEKADVVQLEEVVFFYY